MSVLIRSSARARSVGLGNAAQHCHRFSDEGGGRRRGGVKGSDDETGEGERRGGELAEDFSWVSCFFLFPFSSCFAFPFFFPLFSFFLGVIPIRSPYCPLLFLPVAIPRSSCLLCLFLIFFLVLTLPVFFFLSSPPLLLFFMCVDWL